MPVRMLKFCSSLCLSLGSCGCIYSRYFLPCQMCDILILYCGCVNSTMILVGSLKNKNKYMHVSRTLADIPKYDCGRLISKGFTSMSAYERMPATTAHRALKCLIVVPTLGVTTALSGAHESSPTHKVQRTWPAAPASLQCLARWGHLPRDCGDCSLAPLAWTSARQM